jgi:hypothetical protein
VGSDRAVRPQSRQWPAGAASPASHPVAMPGRRARQSAGGGLPRLSKTQVGIRNFKPTLHKAAERHEAIEAYLAIHAGVSPEAVDEFDRA